MRRRRRDSYEGKSKFCTLLLCSLSQLCLTVIAATSDVSMKVITSGCVGLPAPESGALL